MTAPRAPYAAPTIEPTGGPATIKDLSASILRAVVPWFDLDRVTNLNVSLDAGHVWGVSFHSRGWDAASAIDAHEPDATWEDYAADDKSHAFSCAKVRRVDLSVAIYTDRRPAFATCDCGATIPAGQSCPACAVEAEAGEPVEVSHA